MLTEQEKGIVASFADNPNCMKVVSDIIKRQFDEELLPDMDDKRLGEITRARLEGLRRVDKGFREIAGYRTVKKEQAGLNPAR